MQFDQAYFEKYYQHYSKQNPNYKLNFYHQTISHFHPNAKKLLDAGCAFGSFLGMGKKNYQLFGFDISSYAISLAKKKLPKAHFKVGSVETTKFDSKVDIITLFDVMEHVPNLNQTFKTLNSQLEKGGIIVFVIPVYDGLTGKVVNILDKDPSHINKFSRQKWLSLINKHFAVVSWQGIFRYLLLGNFYLHFPTKTLKHISPAIIVVGKKK